MARKSFLTKMQEYKGSLSAIRRDYKEITNKLVDVSWGIFDEGCKTLFQKHHDLESFMWLQYTPFWDDDVPSAFSAYVDEPIINDKEIYDIYENDPKLSKAVDDVIDFLTLFHDEVLQKMFGDHMMIKVTRDGIDMQRHEIFIVFEEDMEDTDDDDSGPY